MKFTFDQDEILVQDTARKFLTNLTGIDQKLAREKEAEGFSRAEWKKMAELGWLSLTGDGSGEIHALGILATEIGRAAFASPFLATASAALLIGGAADALRPVEMATSVGSGERILTFVDPSQDYSQVTGQSSAQGIRLTSARMIIDWLPVADAIVVPFEVNGTGGVAVVPRDAAGVGIEPCATFDNARAGFLTLTQAEPEWWAPVDTRRMDETLKCGRLLRAAEAVGGAQGAVRLTADYVNERRQFGVVISSFQAVRHGLADAQALIDGAWLAVWDGLGRAARGEPVEGRAALATWLAKRAFQEAAIKGAQYHGGMGHVVDSHMQFYYRRAGTFHGRSVRDWDLLREVAAHYVEPHFRQAA